MKSNSNKVDAVLGLRTLYFVYVNLFTTVTRAGIVNVCIALKGKPYWIPFTAQCMHERRVECSGYS